MNQKYNKQDILLNGLYLMRRQGYHHTGVSDILKQSGIPKGSFYNFFRSKEDFTLQLMDLYGRSVDGIMDQALDSDEPSPLRRLLTFYSLLVQAYQEEQARNGCLIMNLTTEAAGYNDRIAGKAATIFEVWLLRLAETISEAQNAGEVRSDYPAGELAEFVHQSFYGSLVRSKMLRSTSAQQHMLQLLLDFLRKQ